MRAFSAVVKRARFRKHMILNAHLQDIVQNAAAARTGKYAFGNWHGSWQSRNRKSGGRLAVAFGFRVVEVQRAAQASSGRRRLFSLASAIVSPAVLSPLAAPPSVIVAVLSATSRRCVPTRGSHPD